MSGLIRYAARAAAVLRLRATRDLGALPQHIGVVMDGNRRWARGQGFDDPSVGHRYGAEHVGHLLDWCADAGVRRVTIFVASADNLALRAPGEVAELMRLTETVITQRLGIANSRWQVHLAGRLDLLPDSTAQALRRAEVTTTGRGDAHVTVAIGYDGREEIAGAIRSMLRQEARAGSTLTDLAGRVTENDIDRHTYTAGQPHPDLIIRTSGERRMNGFLLWQSAHSELFFCDVYWPGFRRRDLFRVLRQYARRQRNRQPRATGSRGGV